MPDGLARPRVTVEERAKAGIGHARLTGQTDGDLEEVADQIVVLGAKIEQRGDVAFGYDQDVKRRLRSNIAQGESALVFAEDIAGEPAIADEAERAIGHRHCIAQRAGRVKRFAVARATACRFCYSDEREPSHGMGRLLRLLLARCLGGGVR